MKKIVISFATVFAIMLPNVGMSLTATALKEMCNTDGESPDGAGCIYYILAAREGLLWGAKISGYRTRDEGQTTAEVIEQAKENIGVCIPSGTPNRTVLNRILNYIEIVDVSEEEGATLMVYDALKLSYPCE